MFGDVSPEWQPRFDIAWLQYVSGVSHDPIESTPNLYAYCGDNPANGTDPSGLEKVDGIPISIETVIGETSLWDVVAPVSPAGEWGQPASRTSGTITKGDASLATSITICGADVCNGIRQGTGVGAGGTMLAKVNLPGPGNYKVTWLWQVCATTVVPSGAVTIKDCNNKCAGSVIIDPSKTTKTVCDGHVTSTIVSVTKAGWVTVVTSKPALSHRPAGPAALRLQRRSGY